MKRILLMVSLALVLCASAGVAGAQVMSAAGGQLVRGTVTAVSAEKLTVKTETGEVYDVVAGSNSRLMKDRQPVKMTEFKVGESVFAAGQMDVATKTLHALIVSAVDAEQEKKMREGLGKVYIAGKITAIDGTKITVERPDKVVQVIEVDENTSFRKGGRIAMSGGGGAAGVGAGAAGGESITLADFKVGDNVAGPGEVKGKTFVAKQLNLVEVRLRRGGGDGTTTLVVPK